MSTVPARLACSGLGDVEAIELADTGQVFGLRVDALDAEAARSALQRALPDPRTACRLVQLASALSLPPERSASRRRPTRADWSYHFDRAARSAGERCVRFAGKGAHRSREYGWSMWTRLRFRRLADRSRVS